MAIEENSTVIVERLDEGLVLNPSAEELEAVEAQARARDEELQRLMAERDGGRDAVAVSEEETAPPDLAAISVNEAVASGFAPIAEQAVAAPVDIAIEPTIDGSAPEIARQIEAALSNLSDDLPTAGVLGTETPAGPRSDSDS